MQTTLNEQPQTTTSEHPNRYQGAAWTREHNPWVVSDAAIAAGSCNQLSYALDFAKKAMPQNGFTTDDYLDFRREILSHITDSDQHYPKLLFHLLDNENYSVQDVSPSSTIPDQAFIEALLARGWDVNARDPFVSCRNYTLLHFLISMGGQQDALVRWLVEEHGADVGVGQFDEIYAVDPSPPPLLEICARRGTLSMFQYLEAKGAKCTRRVLHRAVWLLAASGGDPASAAAADDDDDERARIVRYLVEGPRGWNVNAMDATVDHVYPDTLHGHFGTPLNYAVREPKGAATVRWLLAKGADPRIQCPFSSGVGFDAFAHAQEAKCEENLRIIEEWRRLRESEEKSRRL